MTDGGDAYCWGSNVSGQLGNNTTTDTNIPVAVLGRHKFASVSAGGDHTCGLTTGGIAYCWGNNVLGQFGDGTFENSGVPVTVSGGHKELRHRQAHSLRSAPVGITHVVLPRMGLLSAGATTSLASSEMARTTSATCQCLCQAT